MHDRVRGGAGRGADARAVAPGVNAQPAAASALSTQVRRAARGTAPVLPGGHIPARQYQQGGDEKGTPTAAEGQPPSRALKSFRPQFEASHDEPEIGS